MKKKKTVFVIIALLLFVLTILEAGYASENEADTGQKNQYRDEFVSFELDDTEGIHVSRRIDEKGRVSYCAMQNWINPNPHIPKVEAYSIATDRKTFEGILNGSEGWENTLFSMARGETAEVYTVNDIEPMTNSRTEFYVNYVR